MTILKVKGVASENSDNRDKYSVKVKGMKKLADRYISSNALLVYRSRENKEQIAETIIVPSNHACTSVKISCAALNLHKHP